MNSKLEDLLNSLESLAGRHANEPETVATIETVAKALHFIQHIGRANDFWEYARVFNTEEAWPKPLRSFASREEALAWLQTQPTLPYEVVLEVAGVLHNVERMPKGDWVLIRFPSLKELESEE
ncbi:hypothetical protein [Cystobacter ferrugineus]|uniref:Uncharacterized protein n=1 Tax=Cystobacter ferrugineus TaxID=83449 RepID=A0A1L9BCM7_9BACT|nr:hypothetical protein [Cystobacter ferrugineus]OJH39978.1 hypothetical protein BON30_12935 [Cystobacter ferrugineus]